MKKAHRNFQVKPWMGCMGFLGFLGFLPKHGGGRNYLFFVFFAFFAWFFWGLLYKEPADERLVENETRAMRIVGGLFALLSFLLLFLLTGRGLAGIRCFCSGLWGIRCALWRLQLLLITWTGRREPWTALFVI